MKLIIILSHLFIASAYQYFYMHSKPFHQLNCQKISLFPSSSLQIQNFQQRHGNNALSKHQYRLHSPLFAYSKQIRDISKTLLEIDKLNVNQLVAMNLSNIASLISQETKQYHFINNHPRIVIDKMNNQRTIHELSTFEKLCSLYYSKLNSNGIVTQ